MKDMELASRLASRMDSGNLTVSILDLVRAAMLSKAALLHMQWLGEDGDCPSCNGGACGGYEHKPGCRLSAALVAIVSALDGDD